MPDRRARACACYRIQTAGFLRKEARTEMFDNQGEAFTIVKDLKKELGPGLLADMCRQLGIKKEDL